MRFRFYWLVFNYILLNSATYISGPKFNFVIWHNYTHTSPITIIYHISRSKCFKRYIGWNGRSLNLTDLMNTFVPDDHVGKPVARHFNRASHSSSDIKVSALSHISGGNDSRRKQELKYLFFFNSNSSSSGAQQTIFFYFIPLYLLFLSSIHGRIKAVTTHS